MMNIYDDHLGVIWEPSGSHLGVIWGSSGSHFGVIWDPFGSHLGTQEAPGGTQEARDILESECVKSYVFYCRKWRDRPFHLHGSDVTCTKYCK